MSGRAAGEQLVEVTVNGEARELPRGATVEEAIAAFGVAASLRGVAVAVDAAVVPRGQWASTRLRGGERIEVLRAVQGG